MWSMPANLPLLSYQFGTGMFFALVFTLRGPVNSYLLLLEIFLTFVVFILPLPAQQLLKTPSPYHLVFLSCTFKYHFYPSPHVTPSSQLLSCYLLPSCAMLHSLSKVWGD